MCVCVSYLPTFGNQKSGRFYHCSYPPPPPPPLQTKYFSYTHAVKRGRWKQINRALHSAPKSMSHSYVLYFENPNLCLTPFIRPIMPSGCDSQFRIYLCHLVVKLLNNLRKKTIHLPVCLSCGIISCQHYEF